MSADEPSWREDRKRRLDDYLRGQQVDQDSNKKPKLETSVNMAVSETCSGNLQDRRNPDAAVGPELDEVPSVASTGCTEDADIKPQINIEVEASSSPPKHLNPANRILLMWCKYCGHRLKFNGVEEFKEHSRLHEEALRTEGPAILDLSLNKSVSHNRSHNFDTLIQPQLPQQQLDSSTIDEEPLDLTVSSSVKAFTSEPAQAPTSSTSTSDWPCNRCDRKFMTRGSLSLHFNRSHVQVRTKRYPCEFCGKVFVYKIEWDRHQRIHRTKKTHQCEICMKEFPKGQFGQHVELHKDCRNCGKTFSRYNSLLQHLKNCKPQVQIPPQQFRHGMKQPDHRCHICCQEFSNLKGLKSHLKVHIGEDKYKCKYCDEEFVQWESLKVHLSTHTGEKPYECLVCGRKFPIRALLVKHKKNSHSEVSAQQPDFVNSVNVSVVHNNHEDQKPKPCPICSSNLPCECAQEEKERHLPVKQDGGKLQERSQDQKAIIKQEMEEEVIDEAFEVPPELTSSLSGIGQGLAQGDFGGSDNNKTLTNLDAILNFDMEFF